MTGTITTERGVRRNDDGATSETAGPSDRGATRREVVRRGVRLAFVAPVISTFFARDAYAASYSCYPQGHVCRNDASDPEPCCDTLTCNGNPGTCEP
jgi:hypothetical protein